MRESHIWILFLAFYTIFQTGDASRRKQNNAHIIYVNIKVKKHLLAEACTE